MPPLRVRVCDRVSFGAGEQFSSGSIVQEPSGKHQCRSTFFNRNSLKLQAIYKKEAVVQVFSSEY